MKLIEEEGVEGISIISSSHTNRINNMQVLIYKGLLEQAVDSKDKNQNKILKKRAVRYIRHCITQFIISKD